MDYSGTFSEWLKLRRKMLDLTQVELAQRAGCSVFALRKIESGERKPSKQLAGLLAAALEIPPEERQDFIRAARGEINPERLRAPALRQSSGPAPLPESVPPLRHLPVQTVPMLGRQAEMFALERLFGDPQCRLLTLMGLGGIGKTRLAVGFASSQLSMFPGGVCYVSLASLRSPDLIVPAIADVFGLTFSGPIEPKEQLLNVLASQIRQPLLLVLDNLEHLLFPYTEGSSQPDTAGLVMEILARLPNVKILATSRERLNLQGEWMFELHGLPVPPLDFSGQLEDYGAGAVFLLSARRVKADFEIKREDRLAVIRICHLLEGIPLAIELAAGWVGLLSCQEIAYEIEANLDFLITSVRDVPARHRSMRATFDHSWKLLSDDERCILRRLSVFHGGFSRQAVEQITGASLPVLATLHTKSLVRRSEEGRFDLHEVIRQYALPHFASDPQNPEIQDRHSEYYLGLVKDREKALKSAAQQEVVRELTIEMDNVRAAWAWAIQREAFPLIGGALRSFGWLCDIVGWLREGIELMEPVVRALRSRMEDEEGRRILGQALAQQGLLFFRKGLFNQSQRSYEESLGILRPIGDPALLTDPLLFSGILTFLMGDMEGARALLEEAYACAQAAGDQWFEAYALYNFGYLDSLDGQYAEGYEQMLVGLAIWRALGDPSSISLGLNYISPAAIKLGYLSEAQDFLQESLSLCMQVGDRWGMGTAYRNLGLVALAQGEAHQAQALLGKSLEIFGDYIVGWDIARSLTYLGDAALMCDDLAGAQKAYLDALHLALEAKSPPVALDAVVGLGRVQLRSGKIEQAFELAEFVAHHPAGIYETKTAASQLALEAGKFLNDRQILANQERAMTLSLETISIDREFSRL